MTLNTIKFTTMYKAFVDTTGVAPSGGETCAIVTLRYIRNEMVADVVGDKEESTWTAEDMAMVGIIRESINELIKELATGTVKLAGFACNASAAAKAAGFKTAEVKGLVGIVD